MLEEKRLEIYRLVAPLLVENGLGDWHIVVKDVHSYYAKTVHHKKQMIYALKSIIIMTEEQMLGMIYHEIAHALVGPGHAHDPVFRQKYFELTGNYNYASRGIRIDLEEVYAQRKSNTARARL